MCGDEGHDGQGIRAGDDRISRTRANSPPGKSVGFRALILGNREFRRLWLGQVVSQLGDWFSSIAIYSLLLEYTGSGRAVAWALLCQLLPLFLFGPLAGLAADRWSRKRILIASDCLRGLVVLGYLWADHPERYAWIYPILLLQVSLSAFFLPARQAVLPSVTNRREILTANALSGVTWSVMLALGAGLGGTVAAFLGRPAAFLLDSFSYFLSAWILLPLPNLLPPARKAAAGFLEWSGLRDVIEGTTYLRRNPGLLSVLLVKSAWGISGGILLLYSIFGQQIFPLGMAGAASIGLLYAARGIGAAIGPVATRAWLGEKVRSYRWAIGVGFFVSGGAFVLFALSPSLPLALAASLIAHTGGSTVWVFSTTLLHHRTAPAFLGRVFAAEQAAVTLTMAVSTWLTGEALDRGRHDPRTLAALLGGILFLPGMIWWVVQSRGRHWYRGWDHEGNGLEEAPPY